MRIGKYIVNTIMVLEVAAFVVLLAIGAPSMEIEPMEQTVITDISLHLQGKPCISITVENLHINKHYEVIDKSESVVKTFLATNPVQSVKFDLNGDAGEFRVRNKIEEFII